MRQVNHSAVQLALFLLFLPTVSSAERTGGLRESSSLRCGSELVTLGDFSADVMTRCGSPFRRLKTESQGTVMAGEGKSSLKKKYETDRNRHDRIVKKARQKESGRGKKVTEVWYYDLGPNDFIYGLHFEGGVLKKIVQGGRGKGQ